MLKRNDLAKQFELIVKQEITNHNASILATNKAINEMREQVTSLTQEFSRHTARNDAWFKQTQEEFLRLERSLEKKIQKNSIDIEGLKKKTDSSNDFIWAEIDSLEAKLLDLDEFQEYKDSMKMELAEVHNHVKSQNEYIKAALYKIRTDLEKTTNAFIKEIRERPDHLWDVKQELEKKIEATVIDSMGVLKELQVHKKDAFIMEKKLENIYSLIEKLKTKIAS